MNKKFKFSFDIPTNNSHEINQFPQRLQKILGWINSIISPKDIEHTFDDGTYTRVTIDVSIEPLDDCNGARITILRDVKANKYDLDTVSLTMHEVDSLYENYNHLSNKISKEGYSIYQEYKSNPEDHSLYKPKRSIPKEFEYEAKEKIILTIVPRSKEQES